MDEIDMKLINIHPIEREWNPDELADWREEVERFTKIDALWKLYEKTFRSRNFATDILMGLHFIDKKLDENHLKEFSELRSMIQKEDEEFWISNGIHRKSEEWKDVFHES